MAGREGKGGGIVYHVCKGKAAGVVTLCDLLLQSHEDGVRGTEESQEAWGERKIQGGYEEKANWKRKKARVCSQRAQGNCNVGRQEMGRQQMHKKLLEAGRISRYD